MRPPLNSGTLDRPQRLPSGLDCARRNAAFVMTDSVQADLALRLAEAVALANADRFDEAIRLLDRLRDAHPTVVHLTGFLGGTLYRAGRLDEAVGLLRQAAAAAPNKDLPSIALFHCLWGLDRHSEACDELVRFLRSYESELYRELLSDLGWKFDRDTGTLTEAQLPESDG